jgi:hypothetical protein
MVTYQFQISWDVVNYVLLVFIIVISHTRKHVLKKQDDCLKFEKNLHKKTTLGVYENAAVAADSAQCSSVGK